ncbi:sensor histidine kinase [uncultured Jatrophihabitans sp.]|uniref:sensor histidine kinase n=1 Tax=uncultured Jatrophihabitans sp. TaxID=1610747 RepID=UPI0035C9B0B3
MRRRILLLVVGMTTLVVLAFAIPLAILIRRSVYQDATTRLESAAGQFVAFLRGAQTSPTDAQITAYLKSVSVERSVSVELPTGTGLGAPPPGDLSQLDQLAGAGGAAGTGGSEGAGGASGESAGGPGARGGPQSSAQSWAGGQLAQLRLFGRDGLLVVRVYASDSQLRSGETGWWLLLAGASVGLLLAGAFAGEVLTRRIVRPLVQSAATASQLAAGDTLARAPTDGPTEVADVGRGLNRLADRIDELIAEERETVADLSHRLRTPLTALRLDAESLRDPADAERVGTHVSNLERMLTAVIHAARRPQREGRIPSCDATAVVADRFGFWTPLADDQGRRGELALPDAPVPVRASAEDLAAAVDALVENVVAHTPEGVDFAVRLVPTATGARLEVADEGPGLPPDAVLRGRSDRGSTGLGLDIARRCAEASGGRLTTGAGPGGGALVMLELGAP